jgi:antitoxin component of RelBE/YafQ-DinJ toxin-antitoxin module
LNLCEAKPLTEYGDGVYELSKFLRMGIVIIDRLEYSQDTLWLKMLGDKNSARRAFGGIEQLSPNRREKNDIIKTSLKYCVYLRGLPTESLTEEEQEFMRTMEQVDAWYEAEMTKAQQDAKLKQTQSLVLRQLNRRVGNVSSETEVRVQSLSLARIEQLGEALLDFGQMGDLIGWLDVN